MSYIWRINPDNLGGRDDGLTQKKSPTLRQDSLEFWENCRKGENPSGSGCVFASLTGARNLRFRLFNKRN